MVQTILTRISKELYRAIQREKMYLESRNKCGRRKRRITLAVASQSLYRRIK